MPNGIFGSDGSQPDLADVPKIQAPPLIHNAALDKRFLDGAGPFEAALEGHGKPYEAYVYDGANRGFHNDTTPPYDGAAAKLA